MIAGARLARLAKNQPFPAQLSGVPPRGVLDRVLDLDQGGAAFSVAGESVRGGRGRDELPQRRQLAAGR
jgi:hypothetical protein